MKVILQSRDDYSKLGEFDLLSKTLRVFSKSEKSSKEKHGIFRHTEAGTVCFFRSHQGLSVAVDKHMIILEKGDKILLHQLENGRKQFSVQRDEDVVFSVTYAPPEVQPYLGVTQLFSIVDEED
ncbi:MAG: hypothetical protein L0287_20150, partial [Anaerolineae bacterium]|nr:hypothetical protein [Anaerolineae bacterium]